MMDVRDTGKKPTPGSGVRLSQTSVDLAYHSDNAHNDAPAQYVGLLMLRAARDGGLSRVKSFYTVHNYLLQHHPEKLKRLYQPMFWDRMREHGPRTAWCSMRPIFKFEDGKLKARLGIIQIRNAYAMIDGGMDKETEEALAAVEEAFDEEASVAEMMLSPGQMQFLNNAIIGTRERSSSITMKSRRSVICCASGCATAARCIIAARPHSDRYRRRGSAS